MIHLWTQFALWIGPFLYHVSPALVTVALGAFAVQRFFVRKSNESALIDTYLEALESIASDALEYWNTDATAKNQKECRRLEQRLVGNIRTLAVDLERYAARYCKKKKFAALMVEITDACTGGAFQTANRVADTGRYMLVLNSINRVKTELLAQKL